MAAATDTCGNRVTLDCIVCSTSFSFTKAGPGRYPRFCSPECKGTQTSAKGVEYRQRKAMGVRLNRYPVGVTKPTPVVEFTCIECSTRTQRGHSPLGNKFCTDHCRDAWHTRAKLGDRSERRCAACGDSFTPRVAGLRYCSTQCRKLSWSAKKRARKAGARVETVSPLKVFERDGWRCHLCGIKTKQHLRGTSASNAPELDHIVPLSKGGEHSYRNTACSCRGCNGRKGASLIGQMRLFG